MNKTDGIASVTYLPPCYCSHGGMGKDLTTGEYTWDNPYKKPVFVRINGRKREAKRWLWRLVARVQGWDNAS